jgi:hypothetical protein
VAVGLLSQAYIALKFDPEKTGPRESAQLLRAIQDMCIELELECLVVGSALPEETIKKQLHQWVNANVKSD